MDPCHVDNDGMNALHYLTSDNIYNELVRKLLSAGISISQRNKANCNPLEHAIQRYKKQHIKILDKTLLYWLYF